MKPLVVSGPTKRSTAAAIRNFGFVALLLAGSAFLAFGFSVGALAHGPKVTPLFQTDLKDFPGREGLVITVDLPPGDPGSKHRHDAHTFVYVLEGSVVMQVEGGERKVLKTGDTFYETPDDIHTVGMNASQTEPAKLLVFFIKKKDAPPVEPVP